MNIPVTTAVHSFSFELASADYHTLFPASYAFDGDPDPDFVWLSRGTIVGVEANLNDSDANGAVVRVYDMVLASSGRKYPSAGPLQTASSSMTIDNVVMNNMAASLEVPSGGTPSIGGVTDAAKEVGAMRFPDNTPYRHEGSWHCMEGCALTVESSDQTPAVGTVSGIITVTMEVYSYGRAIFSRANRLSGDQSPSARI